jgi:4-hydroxythreonine-4-phosphate dehydrogenase
MKDGRPVVGITLGDVNGIGPELVLKLFAEPRLHKFCLPILYGSGKALYFYKNQFGQDKFNYQQINTPQQVNDKRLNFIETSPEFERVEPGVPAEAAGKVAFAALERATDHLKNGHIDALVTMPIDKYTIQSPQFQFRGHTEYLQDQLGAKDVLMILMHENLRVSVVTIHIPLREVASALSEDKIVNKLRLLNDCLRVDFNIRKPKLAVLGLNPHAGDRGLIGNEEQTIISKAIERAKGEKILVMGPYPADGFFASRTDKKFDAVLAMYHDQGLIPFKTICEGHGVNYTAGLPVIRTSPDHGTAYDIAGKNIADETSARQAIYVAVDAFKARLENKELLRNALGDKPLPAHLRSAEDEVLKEE